MNYSNPAIVRDIYERWVSGHGSRAAETALQFRRYAESKENDVNNFRDVQIETEIFVKATPERCFDALTKDYNEWFPHRFKPGSTVYSDAHVGGTNGERFANGGGAIHGTVLYSDAPTLLIVGGAGAMLDGSSSFSRVELVPSEGGTILKRRMRFWGIVRDEFEEMMTAGSRALLEGSFRAYVESGTKYEEAHS